MSPFVQVLSLAITITAGIGCLPVVWFFGHRKEDRLFQAFYRFFLILFLIFCYLIILDGLALSFSFLSPKEAAWRPILLRGMLASAIWYLVFTLRRP